MRYDLKLDFKRMETVKAEKGYHGPVVVCAIYFVPVAGYIPDRPVIKYLSAQRNMEIAFAPVAGTRILVPFRMVIPTPLGTAMLEATQFVTTPTPPARGQDELIFPHPFPRKGEEGGATQRGKTLRGDLVPANAGPRSERAHCRRRASSLLPLREMARGMGPSSAGATPHP